jgi:hypothetical protein
MKRCVQNVEESVPCEKLGKFLVRQDRGGGRPHHFTLNQNLIYNNYFYIYIFILKTFHKEFFSMIFY